MTGKLVSLDAALKSQGIPLSSQIANKALLDIGVLREVEYQSTVDSSVSKRFKEITPEYLHLGENVSTFHPFKTNCRYYDDQAGRLMDFVRQGMMGLVEGAMARPVSISALLQYQDFPFGDITIFNLLTAADVIVDDGLGGFIVSDKYRDYGETVARNDFMDPCFYPSKFSDLMKLVVDKVFFMEEEA